VANCFTTDSSKALTPRVLIFFVNGLPCGVCFEIGHFRNHALSLPLFFLAMRGGFLMSQFLICIFHFVLHNYISRLIGYSTVFVFFVDSNLQKKQKKPTTNNKNEVQQGIKRN
jgi:hypothetical protein